MSFDGKDYTLVVSDFDCFDLVVNAVVASHLAFQGMIGIGWLAIRRGAIEQWRWSRKSSRLCLLVEASVHKDHQ